MHPQFVADGTITTKNTDMKDLPVRVHTSLMEIQGTATVPVAWDNMTTGARHACTGSGDGWLDPGKTRSSSKGPTPGGPRGGPELHKDLNVTASTDAPSIAQADSNLAPGCDPQCSDMEPSASDQPVHDPEQPRQARRIEYPGVFLDTAIDLGLYYRWDVTTRGAGPWQNDAQDNDSSCFVQTKRPSDTDAIASRGTGRRAVVPQRDLEELQADFRQRVRCQSPASVQRFLQELLGECLSDENPLPLEAHRYPIDEDEWVGRAHDLLCRFAPRLEPGTGSTSPTPPGQGCIMQAAHVWRDGTWSSVEDLLSMGRFVLVPPSVALAGLRPSEAVEDKPDEPDVSSLFQATRPHVRTWEELMDVFWGWFEEGRQVGLAVQMVRRFVQDRDQEDYVEWSQPAVAALAAGIPVSSGVSYELSPADFYLWATEVETILYQASQQGNPRGQPDNAVNTGHEMETEQLDLMERGRRGGERQRRSNRGDRSRSDHAPRRRRRQGAPASGATGAGTARGSRPANRTAEHLRAAPWRTARPEVREARRGGGVAGVPAAAEGMCEAASSSSGPLSFRPAPPRDNDECVDIWRHLLGVDTTALPNGQETTSQDGPFIPDPRAEYIRTVLAGFSAQQQALMTLGLLTAFRAMMAELGVVLHAASFVEVVPEGVADGTEENDESEEDDGIPTLMLQLDAHLLQEDGISLVQRDASVIAGALSRLQDALAGPDAGVSRLRAAHLRHRVHRLRLNSYVEASVSDQVEALCVVTEAAGESAPARGYLALEDQVAEWSWSWWRVLEPLLLNQPDDPPNAQDTFAISSSGDGSLQTRTAEVQEVDIDQLAADQEVERNDAEALLHQQALYENEEERYYQGVEAVVEAEVSAQAAREARAWDDWAMHDEMYASPRARKRLCLEVSVGPEGHPGSGQTWRVPVTPGQDHLVRIRLGHMVVEDQRAGATPVPSEVSTVPAILDTVQGQRDDKPQGLGSSIEGNLAVQPEHDPLRTAGRDSDIPMDFDAFQRVYERWRAGEMTDRDVQTQCGQATLELLESQRIVLDFQDEADEPAETMAQGVSDGGVATDTLLDTMLATCQSELPAGSMGSEQAEGYSGELVDMPEGSGPHE